MSRSLYAALHRRFGPERGFSRRDVLRAALAAGAGLALEGCAASRRMPGGRPRAHRTLIVGAGLGGLACADELLARGSRVTVLEARGRVGGRVHSLADLAPGESVEAGGEFIGSNHPLWLAYASRFGLEVAEIEGEILSVVLDGRRLSLEETIALYREMRAVIRGVTDRARPIDADAPWTAETAASLDREPISTWLAGTDASPLCRRALTAQLEADNGVVLEAQSTLAHLAMIRGGGLEKYWTDSEEFRCRGGNQKLASALLGSVGRENVELNEPVDSIRAGDAGVAVGTASGRTFEADDVVLATPPTTWSGIRFEPPLPEGLRPQMGLSLKHLSAVRKRFWKASGLSPDVFSDGDVAWTWEATPGGDAEALSVLTAFSSASQAARCRSDHGQGYAARIEALLPGYLAHAGEVRFMDWPGDPWTRAGYSFPAPGEVTTVGPILRQGLGRLHFAGEHASTKFPGYMEGALDSGVRVAREIAVREGWSQPTAGSSAARSRS